MNPEGFCFDSMNLTLKPRETHNRAIERKAKSVAGLRSSVVYFYFISVSTSRILFTPV